MIKFYKNWSWAIWNGIAPSIIFNVSVSDWEWWALTVPMCLLVAMREDR